MMSLCIGVAIGVPLGYALCAKIRGPANDARATGVIALAMLSDRGEG